MSSDFIYTPPENRSLDVLYCDKDVVLVSKPEGLLSVPGKREEHKDCLESRLKEFYPEIKVVHRLDMATSGIMVFARNAKAHRNISAQFERRKVYKEYIAHIWGKPKLKKGTIDLPLVCDWPNRPKQKIDHIKGRQAVTDWELVNSSGKQTIVKLFPKTGRSHQLRVHMQAIGHPIIGDVFYGDKNLDIKNQRLMLHSNKIGFHLPKNGDFVYFYDPCPF
jgi:tRNA pseudouridine32 synthase/23S rRNA pseudouridine746 synthase